MTWVFVTRRLRERKGHYASMSNLKTTDRLLTEREAAEYLAVSPMTLRKWRCTRMVEVPYIKLGKAVRYQRKDLDAFLQDHRVEYSPLL